MISHHGLQGKQTNCQILSAGIDMIMNILVMPMGIHLIQNQSLLQIQSPHPIDTPQILLRGIVAQLEPTKINSTTEPFLTKVSIIRIRTPSKNAKMLAPTIIMLVSKTPSLAGVTMILTQSLDMELLTVVKLEDQNATTSMTTSAKEACSLLTKFFTSMPILL
jgi:hypothetical protein